MRWHKLHLCGKVLFLFQRSFFALDELRFFRIGGCLLAAVGNFGIRYGVFSVYSPRPATVCYDLTYYTL